MKIFHLSDIHFGNPNPEFDSHELAQAFIRFKEDFADPNTYLVVTGDITVKGTPTGYTQAAIFFEETWLSHGGERTRFITCPGNHDITEKGFEPYDAFVYRIRRDDALSSTKSSANFIRHAEVGFLSINSAHHCDKQYGFVDIAILRQVLEHSSRTIHESKYKIAVIHHHLINVFKNDISAIRNSAMLIALLDEYKFDLILHGHQHLYSSLTIGASNMQILSGRSFSFSTRGYVNGLSVVENNGSRWEQKRLVLSNDNSPSAGLGFKVME